MDSDKYCGARRMTDEDFWKLEDMLDASDPYCEHYLGLLLYNSGQLYAVLKDTQGIYCLFSLNIDDT